MWQKENIRKFHYFLYEFSMIAYLGKISTNTIKSCMCFVGIISLCKRYKDSTQISYIPKSRFSWHYNCDSKSFFLVDMIVRARQILTITLTIQSLRTQSSSVPISASCEMMIENETNDHFALKGDELVSISVGWRKNCMDAHINTIYIYCLGL